MSELLALQKRRNLSFYFVRKYGKWKLSLYICTNTTAKSNERCHQLQDVKNRERQTKNKQYYNQQKNNNNKTNEIHNWFIVARLWCEAEYLVFWMWYQVGSIRTDLTFSKNEIMLKNKYINRYKSQRSDCIEKRWTCHVLPIEVRFCGIVSFFLKWASQAGAWRALRIIYVPQLNRHWSWIWSRPKNKQS